MKNSQDLKDLFIKELNSIYNSEDQITQALPLLIKITEFSDLNDALSVHLIETENQKARLIKIFRLLNIKPSNAPSVAMEGLLKEAYLLAKNKIKSPTVDASIISTLQKVEHFEIASYGTLGSFAKHLELEDDIIDLLKETLEEEIAIDQKLTKLAEGTLFSKGINKEAAKKSSK